VKILKAVTVSGLVSVVSAGTTAGAWLTGTDPHHAVTGLPGAANWPAAILAAAPGTPVPDIDSATPDQIERFFAGLSPADRTAVARRAPGVVGNLDGAPYKLRYTANKQVTGGIRTAGLLLAYDRRGDGRIIEVFGDLASAEHIVVIVPGSGWDRHAILTRTGPEKANPVAGAQALRAEMLRQAPSARVAVVVWLGYDTPENIDRQAARSERAIPGARDLTRFVAGLPGTAPVSLVGHSYGTVVVGRAAAHSPRATEVVALASPGMDTGSAPGLDTRARVWAARVPGDPIGYSPHVRLGGYGHGTDPIDPRFGARIFRTGSAQGHGGYYAPGTESLANLARIALGRTPEVTLVEHAH
jgi:pimeloyl-ACP methyl ester carboxylesterase